MLKGEAATESPRTWYMVNWCAGRCGVQAGQLCTYVSQASRSSHLLHTCHTLPQKSSHRSAAPQSMAPRAPLAAPMSTYDTTHQQETLRNQAAAVIEQRQLGESTSWMMQGPPSLTTVASVCRPLLQQYTLPAEKGHHTRTIDRARHKKLSQG